MLVYLRTSMSVSSDRLQAKSQRNLLILMALGAILITAFIIRFKAIKFGFPVITHPDEPVIYRSAVHMIKTRDLHPHVFLYPSLYIYLQALLYKTVFWIGKLLGTARHFSDVSYLTLYFWGRFLTVVLSAGTIFLTYLAGCRLFNRTIGLLSALLISLSALHFENSYYITTDSPMGFWVVLSFLMSVLILTEEPKLWRYLLNGLFIGLAAGTKYNAVFALVPLIVAHLLRTSFSIRRLFDKRLLLALLVVPVVFVLTTPYAVLDFPLFWNYLKYQNLAYRSHPFGIERNVVGYGGYFIGLLRGFGAVPMIFAGFGLYALFRKSVRSAVLLLSFPLTFFMFMGAYPRIFMRNMVVILPFLGLFGAFGAWTLTRYLWSFRSSPNAFRRRLSWALAAAVVIGTGWGLFGQGMKEYRRVQVMTLPNTRWLAEKWIDAYIPRDARIIKEYYTPSVRNKRKVVDLGVAGFAKKRVKYDLKGFDYIILSSDSHGRFFAHPERFPDEVRIYRNIMSAYPLRKIFVPDNTTMTGPVIRIYQVRRPASAQEGKAPPS